MWNVLTKKSSNHKKAKHVDTLVSMGFTQDQAIHALEVNSHNLEEATNYLLSNGGAVSGGGGISSQGITANNMSSTGSVSSSQQVHNHRNETEEEQLQRIMAESIQLEENRKAKAAKASGRSSTQKTTTTTTKTTAKKQHITSAASLKAGQAALTRAEMANQRFGANGKILTNKKKKTSTSSSLNVENIEKYRPQGSSAIAATATTSSSSPYTSQLKVDKSTLKDHPTVKMPTQMKDKTKEEQIIRCTKRLASHPHAVDTLLRAFRMIRQNPNNDKYRKIDKSTIGFQTALEGKPGAMDLIHAINFRQRSSGHHELVLDRNDVDLALLYLADSALEEIRSTEEYKEKKEWMVFEKELERIQNGDNNVNKTNTNNNNITTTKEEDEIVQRAAYISKLPSEPTSGAGALMQITLGKETTIKRRFDGDDILQDVLHFIGGHGSLIPSKILSREWCLVDLNRYPIVPIDVENDKMKTLQHIGCWPSGRLSLKPSPIEWREKRVIGEKVGSSRGLGAASS